MAVIFKILRADEWAKAKAEGVFHGSQDDRTDGFIHFSTLEQAAGTAARHFAGVRGLTLAAVEAKALGAALRWEPSRGGALFPHLYGPLPVKSILWTCELPLGADGLHIFPETE